jgi:hypothetical protein
MNTATKLAFLVILASVAAQAANQPGAGREYDTRDPSSCRSKKEPARGAPSASLLREYVRCSNERTIGGYIGLFENLQVEIGRSRPYSDWSDAGNLGIDNFQPVYPIRVTADFYSCRPPGSMGFPKGRNCELKKATTFEGTCFKTTFGDWSCPVHGTSDPLAGIESNIAPPK